MNAPAHPVGDRRPIASRSWSFSKKAASALVRLGFSPNAISTTGMVFGILGGLSLSLTAMLPHLDRLFWFLGALFIQLRLLANMLDGMVAVESHSTSPVGELYNEIPDRVSDSATLVGLGWAAGSSPILGLFAALLAVFTAYVRAMGKVAGAHQEFCGPMAKPQRMFFSTVLALAATLFPTQSSLHHWPIWTLGFILIGTSITAPRRLLRIAKALKNR